MSNSTIKADNILADLSAYIVTKFHIAPRDAVGMIMQSKLAEDMMNPESPLLNRSVEQLTQEFVNTDWKK